MNWIEKTLQSGKILALSPMADLAPDLLLVGRCGAGMT